MPQRMNAGTQAGGEVAAGCAITLIGAIFLAGSLFFERANDYFYEVGDNRLIEYGTTGPALVALIVGAFVLCLLGFIDRFPKLGPLLLLLVSLACLGLTVLAATDLGVHPTDMGDQSNDIAFGTVLAIASSALMAGGAFVAFGGSAKSQKVDV